MKKPSYARYKRYEREHGLVEWLIKTRQASKGEGWTARQE
jgi:hypothetical protein